MSCIHIAFSLSYPPTVILGIEIALITCLNVSSYCKMKSLLTELTPSLNRMLCNCHDPYIGFRQLKWLHKVPPTQPMEM